VPSEIESEDDDGNTITVRTEDWQVLDPIMGGDVNESELLFQCYADRYGISHFAQGALSRLNDGTSVTIYKSDKDATLKRAFWEQMECSHPATVDENQTAFTFHPKRLDFAGIAAVIRKHF
jgi:hypothetical protein